MKFRAFIKDCTPIYFAQHLFNDFMRKMNGKEVEITIEPKRKKRSNNQNRYLMGEEGF